MLSTHTLLNPKGLLTSQLLYSILDCSGSQEQFGLVRFLVASSSLYHSVIASSCITRPVLFSSLDSINFIPQPKHSGAESSLFESLIPPHSRIPSSLAWFCQSTPSGLSNLILRLLNSLFAGLSNIFVRFNFSTRRRLCFALVH